SAPAWREASRPDRRRRDRHPIGKKRQPRALRRTALRRRPDLRISADDDARESDDCRQHAAMVIAEALATSKPDSARRLLPVLWRVLQPAIAGGLLAGCSVLPPPAYTSPATRL